MSNQQALNLDQLLQSGAAAARGGNRAAARALFVALSREHPEDPRVWRGLAETARDEAEQRAALEQALALDPADEHTRAALARMTGPDPRSTAALAETHAVAETPPQPDQPPPAEEHADEPDAIGPAGSPFPLLNLLALLLILLLLGAVGVIIGRNLLGSEQAAAPTVTPVLALIPGADLQPTPPLAAPTAAPPTALPAATVAPTAPPAAETTAPPGGTAAPETTALPGETAAPETTPAPEIPPPPPAPTSSPDLPLGQVIDYDGWSATLLRPDYAVTLDGAIGDLQPAGRFVLTVIAISNNSPSARTIPAELFTLVDSAGRRYPPAPGASTAYLALYERGQRGDLALEDALEPGSGMRSVPILFDVPLDAAGLRLIMAGAADTGWPIGGSAPAPVGP